MDAENLRCPALTRNARSVRTSARSQKFEEERWGRFTLSGSAPHSMPHRVSHSREGRGGRRGVSPFVLYWARCTVVPAQSLSLPRSPNPPSRRGIPSVYRESVTACAATLHMCAWRSEWVCTDGCTDCWALHRVSKLRGTV